MVFVAQLVDRIDTFLEEVVDPILIAMLDHMEQGGQAINGPL